MVVRKKGSFWATIHCSGKDKGKIIAKFKTQKQAMAQHRAIQASKKRRKKS